MYKSAQNILLDSDSQGQFTGISSPTNNSVVAGSISKGQFNKYILVLFSTKIRPTY